jgi:exonuclease VII small subunit
VRKNYIPYCTKTLQDAHGKITKAREEAETTLSQENYDNLRKS